MLGSHDPPVLGFDACHFPNHYNVLITADTARSGLDLALEPEATIRFESTAATLPDLSE